MCFYVSLVGNSFTTLTWWWPCSFNDDVEEFIPVGRLEPREHHGESLNLFYYATLYVKRLTPTLVVVSHQLYLQEALLHQIIEVVIVAKFSSAELVFLL